MLQLLLLLDSVSLSLLSCSHGGVASQPFFFLMLT
jgi:hypothetical protein